MHQSHPQMLAACLDCLVDFLSPHELKNLYSACKGLKQSVSPEMKEHCLTTAAAKYKRAVRMPDGGLRIHMYLRGLVFDMHPSPHERVPKQMRFQPVKLTFGGVPMEGGIVRVGNKYTTDSAYVPDREFYNKGNAVILSAEDIRITFIQYDKAIMFLHIKTEMDFVVGDNGVVVTRLVNYYFRKSQ